MIRDVSYTLPVLENIGLPLLLATLKAGTPREREVITVREMLDQTVDLTGALEKTIPVGKNRDQKLELAKLAAQAVIAQFEAEGVLPKPGNTAKLLTNIDFLVTHLENQRFQDTLQTENPEQPTSEIEEPLHHLQAFLPIIHAIEEFSYGQSENKLIQNVSDTLLTRSKDMNLKLIGQIFNEDANKAASSRFLSILAKLYAETHRSETRKIMQMSEKARLENGSQITIDIVWRAFERKCAMLEALIEGLIPPQKIETPPNFVEMSIEELLGQHMPSQIVPQAPQNPLSFYKKTR